MRLQPCPPDPVQMPNSATINGHIPHPLSCSKCVCTCLLYAQKKDGADGEGGKKRHELQHAFMTHQLILATLLLCSNGLECSGKCV